MARRAERAARHHALDRELAAGDEVLDRGSRARCRCAARGSPAAPAAPRRARTPRRSSSGVSTRITPRLPDSASGLRRAGYRAPPRQLDRIGIDGRRNVAQGVGRPACANRSRASRLCALARAASGGCRAGPAPRRRAPRARPADRRPRSRRRPAAPPLPRSDRRRPTRPRRETAPRPPRPATDRRACGTDRWQTSARRQAHAAASPNDRSWYPVVVEKRRILGISAICVQIADVQSSADCRQSQVASVPVGERLAIGEVHAIDVVTASGNCSTHSQSRIVRSEPPAPTSAPLNSTRARSDTGSRRAQSGGGSRRGGGVSPAAACASSQTCANTSRAIRDQLPADDALRPLAAARRRAGSRCLHG